MVWQYYAWTRWGRVGVPGQNALKGPFSSPDPALEVFRSKFRAKTLNRWEDRDSFEPRAGKYTLIQLDYGNDDDVADTGKKKGKGKGKKRVDVPESKLSKPVQELISLICNVSMMKKQMVEIGCVPSL